MKKVLLALLAFVSTFAISQSCDLSGADFESGTVTAGWSISGAYIKYFRPI